MSERERIGPSKLGNKKTLDKLVRLICQGAAPEYYYQEVLRDDLAPVLAEREQLKADVAEQDNNLLAEIAQLQAERDQLRLALQESQQEVERLTHANNSWIYENEKWKDDRERLKREHIVEEVAWAKIHADQQTVIQELAEALRKASPWTPSCRDTKCGYCFACQARAALQAAAPWLPKEGE